MISIWQKVKEKQEWELSFSKLESEGLTETCLLIPQNIERSPPFFKTGFDSALTSSGQAGRIALLIDTVRLS